MLSNVNLKITPQSRIGLIGVNGAGKSTLLKCLTQELIPSQGVVSQATNIRVQHLTQNPRLTYGNTLQQELYSVFTDIHDLKNQEAILINELANLVGDDLDDALMRLANLQERLEYLDVGKLDEKIGRMITGLGFALHELDRPVDNFSGGWQMRINLAKVLLQEADVILMDEPTNHLDMEACEWLEQFLRSYPKGILVVSHDRRFLDEVVTEIAELERGVLTLYSGNYTDYVEQRNANREQLAAAAQRQQKSLEKQIAFVERFKASASRGTQAKSREKQLAKIERIEAPKSELKRLAFKFPLPNPSNREVMKLENIAKSFGEHKLFEKVSVELEWTKEEPQRVFILGANGCGKTTLFKILMGIEPVDEGTITFGSRVQLGYYAQHQLQILDPEKTVLKTLEDAMPPTHQTEIRGILGRFLFTGDQVFKKVEIISGGEKARLAIAKLMVTGPNTLLLDEPTNHLDTPAQEAVEEALRDYQGTVICISHDRYLIHNHATQIWEFDNGRMITFKGSYEEYLEKRDLLLAESRASLAIRSQPEIIAPAGLQHAQARKQEKQTQNKIKKLEASIKKLQLEKSKVQEQISDPALASNYEELARLSKELEAVDMLISEHEAQWVVLTDEGLQI